MSTRFFTNRSEHTLFKEFQGVFESNQDIEFFDALIGYLRSSGYFALRPYLEKVRHVRLLVGINVDAIKEKRVEFIDPGLSPRISAVRSAVLNRLSHSGSYSHTSSELNTALQTIRDFRNSTIPFKP